MHSLEDAGTIVIGGPYADDTGGLVAIEAESHDAARVIAAGDPAVRDGVMIAEVHPWVILADPVATVRGPL